jgi:hypothetical protein
MAPTGKQADRKTRKSSTKNMDDEPAATGASSGNEILAAAKQLVVGSVLVEFCPLLPQMLKSSSIAVAEEPKEKEETQDKKEDEDEVAEEPSGSVDTTKETPPSNVSTFESLSTRMPVYNTLGLDKAPEEAWLMFKGLEVDGGPFKRKKGNAALERIMVNVERNLSQYVHILLAMTCLRALLFRSWFACLPWLVGYQFLSLNCPPPLLTFLSLRTNAPVESIKEKDPKMAAFDFKIRVVGFALLHAFVWFFFLYEFVFRAYFFEKIPLIGLLAVHAYVAVPVVNLETARKAIAEKLGGTAAEDEAPATSKSEAGDIIIMVRQLVTESVLAKVSPTLTSWAKEIKAAPSAQEDKSKDKTEADQKMEEDKDVSKDAKSSGVACVLEDLTDKLSLFNVLGLGLPASRQAAKEAWLSLKGPQIDFGPQSKKKGAAKERVLASFARNLPQYLHILLALMCLRSFFFRSWFACLPWLVGYQYISLNMPDALLGVLAASAKAPLQKIQEQFPHLAEVDVKIRVAITVALHAFMWLFFVIEVACKTYFLEKFMLVGFFVAHAYVVNPVPN